MFVVYAEVRVTLICIWKNWRPKALNCDPVRK